MCRGRRAGGGQPPRPPTAAPCSCEHGAESRGVGLAVRRGVKGCPRPGRCDGARIQPKVRLVMME